MLTETFSSNVCGSARKRGYSRFKFIEYTFFYYDYYFYIFTPIGISRSLCMTGKSSSRLFPSRHIIARCVMFRILYQNWTIIFPISFRHGLNSPGFCVIFLFIALVEIRIKQAQRSLTVRPHDGQLQRLPFCCNTRCTHSCNIINLHTLIL